jgi:hypothetical protein
MTLRISVSSGPVLRLGRVFGNILQLDAIGSIIRHFLGHLRNI